MPRLFTGLELPETVAGQLALLRGGVVGARWLEPEDYHITLRFIGDIDARAARDVDETGCSRRRQRLGSPQFSGSRPWRALTRHAE
jgi:RNA 2',3'-cyclic 3'-phosphodiesterase